MANPGGGTYDDVTVKIVNAGARTAVADDEYLDPNGTYEIEVAYTRAADVVPNHGPANTIRVRCMDQSGAAFGATTTVSPSGNGTTYHEFTFDSDPLAGGATARLSGAVDIYVQMERTDLGNWNVSNTGVGDSPAGNTNVTRVVGVFRAWTEPSFTPESPPNGAKFAYTETFTPAVTYDTPIRSLAQSEISLDVVKPSSAVLTTYVGDGTGGATAPPCVVDTLTDEVGVYTARITGTDTMTRSGLKCVVFPQSADHTYVGFAPGAASGGHDQISTTTGWDVDSRLTASNFTLASHTASDVLNRNEAWNGSVTLVDANGNAPGSKGVVTLRVHDIAGSTLEDTVTDDGTVGTTLSFSHRYAVAGNNAPATTAGAQKSLCWVDTGTNGLTVDLGAVGALSRLLDVTGEDNPDGTGAVYNRGHSFTASFTLLNRRGAPFADYTNESVVTVNTGNGAQESTATVTGHDGAGVVTVSATFATSGNVAPADATGAPKSLRWSDNSGNNSVDTASVASLSSLYDIAAKHLQVDDTALDPAKFISERQQYELGYVALKIVDRRGNPVNGATGTVHLCDDADALAPKTWTLTTANVNGFDGWTPLQVWDNTMPGGNWDLFASTQFTKDGNTTADTRQGPGFGEFVLIAFNPAIRVIVGGGPPNKDNHLIPGVEYQFGVGLVNAGTRQVLSVDKDENGDPRVELLIFTIGPLGQGQFLDPDTGTWVDAYPEGVIIKSWPMVAQNPASGIYMGAVPANITATFTTFDVWFVAKVFYKGAPYSESTQIPVTGKANPHSKYYIDPIAFALSGGAIISTR